MGEGYEQTLPKRRHLCSQHMKKCSSSLVLREMQIKTTLRYHRTPVRIEIIKTSGHNRRWRGCGELGTLYTVGGGVNQCNHCGRQCSDFSRIYNQKYHLTQQSYYQVYTQKTINRSTIRTHAHECSLQHYLQQHRHRTNSNAHQLQTG